ncbi:MAG: PCYCGC domain-containing protein [Gemmatimonadetes bacterium]|nr:PCYCGC domain-containing protein [Gemmatimonadota bacterium]
MIDRRSFLKAIPGAAAALAVLPGHAVAQRRLRSDHPDPRDGITGDGVISAEQLRTEGIPEETIALYDGMRQIPEVADGLACYCGCMLLGNRSLLTCFHPEGMARGCLICQGEARIAIRRHAEGQSLEQIRRAIDARFG